MYMNHAYTGSSTVEIYFSDSSDTNFDNLSWNTFNSTVAVLLS